jgi:hypothetical protein
MRSRTACNEPAPQREHCDNSLQGYLTGIHCELPL